MRCSELPTRETIGLVEHNHHTDNSSCADDGTQELPRLLLSGSSTEPVTNLQVGDEATCHRQRRANHAAHDQRCEHARRTFQTYSHHDDRSKDQRHQRHTRDGVAAYDSDGVGCHSSEEEGDDGHEENADDSKEQVALHHTKPEEDEGDEQRHDGADGDDLERDVALRTLHGSCCIALAFELFRSETDGSFDDAPTLDDADDTGHGNTPDADGARISLEDVFR